MSHKIRHCALDLLARREHSKFELERKLSSQGFAINDIKMLIAELMSQGLQSDQRFVESYVNVRLQRGFGPLRIKAELHERGIDQELSEKFLSQDEAKWLELARFSRSKKFGEKIPHDLQRQTRQMRYLYYKGFAADHIRKIFKGL